MTPENFTYWLQGYFEVSGSKTLDAREVQIIKDHLDLVFKKVTPNVPNVGNPDAIDIRRIRRIIEEEKEEKVKEETRYC